ncbi:MAG: putative transcriptional regulator [Candidatus Magasanikbacteria bacterium GW2011_GWA2_46_17]|uniref:Putative transcriptional regulator n=1 Tax=Candidatus Magasanikbacteria bacterium GW2011_GWA2_46_17 TaxID=1619042 RepID=A0A0G1RYM8_9BACT|nr:MAG: putative transcriptional regulator [Candidatus Magasanikbacteria bacterium GW2011_GWA2_46_17]
MHLFFQYPDRSFYVRELARLISTQLNAVRREISNLEQLDLIQPAEPKQKPYKYGDANPGTSRSKYYCLNTGSLLCFEMKSLLLKAEVLEQSELIEEIKRKAGDLSLLLLTGIFSGDKSVDTDMLIVGNLKPVSIAKLIGEFEAKSGKTIRYTLMDDKEFSERREIGDKFLYSLFEGKHVTVIDNYGIN